MNSRRQICHRVWIAAGLCAFALVFGGAVYPAEGIQSHGVVEAGVGRVNLDNPNSKYGEYSGIGDDELYLIGNADVIAGDGPDYLEFHADDIGLDSRELNVQAGRYGVYSLDLSHEAIPHLISSDARTPFDGAGGERLTLPAGFVPAATTSGMTNLEENLKTLDLRTGRKENLFRISRIFKGGWQAKFSVEHEDINGTQSLGGVTAQSPGNADSVILPQPIDYRTEEFAAAVAYNGTDKQIEIGYFLSLFHDDNSSITWDVPFLKAPAGTLAYPTVARMGLPPDNKYQRFNVSGGMNFSGSTRVSAVIELGKMSQDDILLPYSTDDIGGTASTTQNASALPRASADAEVDVKHITLNLASQPMPRLGVDARYKYYKTDNKTPYTLFDRVIDDTVPQSTTTAEIYSRPYDYSLSEFGMGANYRFESGVNLKSDVGRKITSYDQYRPVKKMVEDTLKVDLRKDITDELSGRIGVAHAQRDSDNYDSFLSYSTLNTLFSPLSCPSIVTVTDPDTGVDRPVDTCFRNHPDIRQFDIASRDQSKLYTSLAYSPYETIDISLDISQSRTDYDDNLFFDDTYLGLTSDDNLNITVDVGYTPSELWSVNAYYTNEQIKSTQAGRQFGAVTITNSSAIDSSLNWSADFDDQVNTVGVQGNVDLLYDSLTLIANYAYSRGTSRIRFSAGSGLTYADMPEDTSRRHAVDVNAIYKLRDNIRLGFGLGYEVYKSHDWSLDSVEAGGTAINDILLLTGPGADYRAYLLSATVLYSW